MIYFCSSLCFGITIQKLWLHTYVLFVFPSCLSSVSPADLCSVTQRVSSLHPFSPFGASSARIVPSVIELQWCELNEICRCLLNLRFFIVCNLKFIFFLKKKETLPLMFPKCSSPLSSLLHSNIRNLMSLSLIWMVSLFFLKLKR